MLAYIHLSYSRGGFTILRLDGVEGARVSPLIKIQMAKIHNIDLIKSIIDKAKLQTAVDKVPTELAEKIIPVLVADTTEKLIQVARAAATDATGVTIHTTSETKDTYLTGLHLTISKNNVNDSIISAINATTFGEAAGSVLVLRYEPLTAGQLHASITFSHPIKLEKGTPITISNSGILASIDTTGMIFFYEV